MPNIDSTETFNLGRRTVKRLGYGAMQLAGPGVFGPPKDRATASRSTATAAARSFGGPNTPGPASCMAP